LATEKNYNGPVNLESGEKSQIVEKLFLTSPEEVIQYAYHLFLSVPHIFLTPAGVTYSHSWASSNQNLTALNVNR
jgi:hypothetical protein